MELTAQQVFDAAPIVTKIINEGRPLPQKGLYRLSRIYKALKPEFDTIAERRDALIVPYNYFAQLLDEKTGAPLVNEDGSPKHATVQSVPPDKAGEFLAAWKEIADEVINVPVEPVPLAYLDLGDDAAGSILAGELLTLGELVAE